MLRVKYFMIIKDELLNCESNMKNNVEHILFCCVGFFSLFDVKLIFICIGQARINFSISLILPSFTELVGFFCCVQICFW